MNEQGSQNANSPNALGGIRKYQKGRKCSHVTGLIGRKKIEGRAQAKICLNNFLSISIYFQKFHG